MVDTKAIIELCHELPLIEDRLRRAGLLQTATEMNKAVRIVGYEAAEFLTKAAKEQP